MKVEYIYLPEVPNLYYLIKDGVKYINTEFDRESGAQQPQKGSCPPPCCIASQNDITQA